MSVVREGLETALRERRAEFEVQLLQEKKKVDTFRSREIRDVLSLDELREKVETVDHLCGILKVNKSYKDILNVILFTNHTILLLALSSSTPSLPPTTELQR